MTDDLHSAAERLTRAVDGVDWDVRGVEVAVDAIHRLSTGASRAQLDEALAVLVERLQRAKLEDADGTPHIAITGGTLVERGASAALLGTALLEHLPRVLSAARSFADRYFEGQQRRDDEEAAEDGDVIAFVDDQPLLRPRFRQLLLDDRPGGCAVAYLRQWVLPTIACLTRSRPLLERFVREDELPPRARRLGGSQAHWLCVLGQVQLAAPWLALCPLERRGFELRVDGVCTNFVLHALLGEALSEQGITAARNPREVLDVVRGTRDREEAVTVQGVFDLHTRAALPFLLPTRRPVPLDHFVWNDGSPNDVPLLEGRRVVIAASPTVRRTWKAGRPFFALGSSVTVERELSPGELADWLRTDGTD